MSASVDPVAVVQALVDVSETFIEIAAVLRTIPNVSVAESHLMRKEERIGPNEYRMGKGPGFRLVWYADAMFVGAPSLSVSEEVIWRDGEWTIESAITIVHEDDQDPIVELPVRHATKPADFIEEVESQTRMLRGTLDSALEQFRKHWLP